MDLNTPIDIDKDIENFIKKAKQNDGYLMASDLDAHTFSDLAKRKMIQFGLIEKNPEKQWMYDLTEKGWKFKSFKRSRFDYKKWSFIVGVVLSTLIALIALILTAYKK